MNRALVLALCIGLAITPAASRADNAYALCGPGAAGFIRTDSVVACVGGSADWMERQPGRSATARPQPVPVSRPLPMAVAGTNRQVDDALNKADLSFREGETKTACGWVSSAITSDLTDFGGVPSSKEQREQLKKYAQRCNLRY